jgi:hypothetical protein
MGARRGTAAVTVTETTNTTKRGLCDGCQLPSALPVAVALDRPHNRVVHLHFCDRDCWRRWKLRMERLPDVGLRIG